MASPAAILSILVEANTGTATANLGKYNAELDATKANAAGMTSSTGRATSALKKIGTVAKVGAAAGIAAFAYEAKKSIDTTTELAKGSLLLQKNFGLSAKAASEWASVARARGVDSSKLGMAFKTLAGQIQSAANGSATSIAMFKQLGFSQKDIQKSMTDTNFAMEKVSAGFEHLPAGMDKTATAGKLFGRGWQSIFPILRDGTKAMNDQLQTADKYGSVFDHQTLSGWSDFLAVQRESKLAWQGMQVTLANALMPTIEDVLKQFNKIAAILASDKLSNDEKFQKISDLIQKDLGKISDFVLGLIPEIANNVGKQAPKVAMAFVTGFMQADVWGKLAIGGFLLSKFGGASAIKSIGGKVGTTLSSGIKGTLVSGLKAAGIAALVYGFMGGMTQAVKARAFGGRTQLENALEDWGIGFFRSFGINLGQTSAEAFAEQWKSIADKSNIWSHIGEAAAKKVPAIGNSTAEILSKSLKGGLDRHFSTMNLFGADLVRAMTPDEKALADKITGAANAAARLASQHQIKMPANLITTSPDTAKKLAHSLDDGLDFLKKHVGASMQDILRVVHRNAKDIGNAMGRDSNEGRRAMAKNFREAADAIDSAMRDGMIPKTKQNLDKISQLLRQAKILDPTEKQARDMGRAWADGMVNAKGIVKQGVDHLIGELKKMPKGARDQAATATFNMLKEWNDAGRISDDTFKKLKSNVLSSLSGLKLNAKPETDAVGKATKTIGDSATDAQKIYHSQLLGSSGVVETTRQTKERLQGLYATWPKMPGPGGGGAPAGPTGPRGQRGMMVPGSGSGDKVHALLEPGEGVINRKAVAALGGPSAIAALNSVAARFKKGGVAGMDDLRKLNKSIDGLDEQIDIAGTSAGLPQSPGGTDTTQGERVGLIKLNRQLLGALEDKRDLLDKLIPNFTGRKQTIEDKISSNVNYVKYLKQKYYGREIDKLLDRRRHASPKQRDSIDKQIEKVKNERDKAIAPFTKKIEHQKNSQDKVSGILTDLASQLVDVQGETGQGGRIFEVATALANLRGDQTRGTVLDRLQENLALAQLTPTLADDVKWASAIVDYWTAELARLKATNAPFQQITDAANSLVSAKSELEQLQGQGGTGRGSTLDRLMLAWDKSQLSKGLADDLKAAQGLVSYWGLQLRQREKARASFADISEAAQSLKQWQDTVAQVKDAITGGTGDTTGVDPQVILDLQRELLSQTQKKLAVSQAQYGVFQDFAGMFAKGGVIPKGQWGIAGERGPEVVTGPATVTPGQPVIYADIYIGGEKVDERVRMVVRSETGAAVNTARRRA